MELRKFGNTNEMVSKLGLGGGHLSAVSREEGIKIVDEAFRSGINYFDVAPSYNDGINESIINESLGGRIKDSFIATKVLARSYDEAKKEIEGSLKRLGKIDLLQLHSVDTQEALEVVFSYSGALKAVDELKNQGIIKYVGITNHFDPKVLESSLQKYKFDSVMMPLGIIGSITTSFENLIEKVGSTAIVGILILGDNKMEPVAEQAIRYSLALKASTILVGPKTVEELKKDIDIANRFKPLSEPELDELKSFALNAVRTESPWWTKGPVGLKHHNQ